MQVLTKQEYFKLSESERTQVRFEYVQALAEDRIAVNSKEWVYAKQLLQWEKDIRKRICPVCQDQHLEPGESLCELCTHERAMDAAFLDQGTWNDINLPEENFNHTYDDYGDPIDPDPNY